MDLDICLCTRDPRRDVLSLVMGALARQRVPPGTFALLVVDNGSTPPLPEEILAPVRAAGHPARLAREPRPGLTAARLHAIANTGAPWVLFIDDDNEVGDDFVAEGLSFARSRDDIGCFGGRLLLPNSVVPPRWVEPFLPWLGIKDAGPDVLTGSATAWGPWEPPGAGFWARRDVMDAYRVQLESDARAFSLGRKGARGLASCEDALMARQSLSRGLLNAYQPRLVLRHHLDPRRFRLGYLLRLMHGYGESQVLLDAVVAAQRGAALEIPDPYDQTPHFLRVLVSHVNDARKRGLRWGLGALVYRWALFRAYREHGVRAGAGGS